MVNKKEVKKNLLKSKTVWASIIIGGIGICQGFGLNLPYEVIYSIASGFGLYGLRSAVENKK